MHFFYSGVVFLTSWVKKLQEKGHRLILWTYRVGKELDEAVRFCESKGVHFYAVNKSYPEEKYDNSYSRKIHADLFIDDRNLGGLPEWGIIFRMITESPTE